MKAGISELKDEEKQLLLEEFRQAWEHYRHLENARAWYLGFFYTTAAGGITLIMYLLFRDVCVEPSLNVVLGTYLISCAIGVLALIVLTTVTATGVALSHYANVFEVIRKTIYSKTLFDEVNPKIDVFLNPAVQMAHKGGASKTTKKILWGVFLFVLLYLLLFGVFFPLQVCANCGLARYVSGVGAIIIAVVGILTNRQVKKSEKLVLKKW